MPVENYVVSVVAAYWARWPDARQHKNNNINFRMDTNVKNLRFFSPYYRLHRSSTGQISELLRLRKERYSSFKKRWPDSEKHTVLITFNSGYFIVLFLSDRGRI